MKINSLTARGKALRAHNGQTISEFISQTDQAGACVALIWAFDKETIRPITTAQSEEEARKLSDLMFSNIIENPLDIEEPELPRAVARADEPADRNGGMFAFPNAIVGHRSESLLIAPRYHGRSKTIKVYDPDGKGWAVGGLVLF